MTQGKIWLDGKPYKVNQIARMYDGHAEFNCTPRDGMVAVLAEHSPVEPVRVEEGKDSPKQQLVDALFHTAGTEYLGDPAFSFGNTLLGRTELISGIRYLSLAYAYFCALPQQEQREAIADASEGKEVEFIEDPKQFLADYLIPTLEADISEMVRQEYRERVESHREER